MDGIWDVLQIKATADRREIKRAYACRSKEIHPEEKPEEFQRLYDAYQKAIQYASRGRMMWDGIEVQTGTEAENSADSDVQDRYRELGLDLEEIQRKQRKLKKIERFLHRWEKGAAEWERTGKSHVGNGKRYLLSEEFREIMWSPAVMEAIAEGILKYFQREEEVLSFFGELYGFEAESVKENERGIWAYRNLHPAYMEKEKRQQIQQEWLRTEKIKYFQCCWKKQIFVWADSEMFLSEDWREYLKSSEFQEIMWAPAVLETVTKGLAWYDEQRRETASKEPDHYEKKQEILLFFWELYGFEKLGEENCRGEKLLLYKKLYPIYINHRKREWYEKNRDEELKKERRHIWKLSMVWSGVFIIVMIGMLVLRFIPLETVFAGALIVVVLGALILLFIDNKETKWF